MPSISAVDVKPELEKYELAEQIGLGGMATVYRARDRRLGRDVAVKLIHPHLRGSVEVAARFASEGRTVAKLKHPNIVEVYDISDEQEPERYLIVELIKGPTLRQVLLEYGPLPPELAASLALQLAAALGHAHSQGIVHRDVKPENVLIQVSKGSIPAEGSSGTTRAMVKLTDFGIAKLLDAHGVTSTGQVLGSPAHMAPEQIEGGDVGPRADVFGLGVLLYESMVGQLPFDGKNPAQVLRRVLEGAHPSGVSVRPEIGAQWSALLDRALARDVAARYPSVEEFAGALREELRQSGLDPQREIDRCFEEPKAYVRDFSERIVPILAERGRQARADGDIARACAEFNRALAYRPSDPELLRAVSALARRAQAARIARGVGLGAAFVAMGVGVVYAIGLRDAGSDVRRDPTPAGGRVERVVPSLPAAPPVSEPTSPGARGTGPAEPAAGTPTEKPAPAVRPKRHPPIFPQPSRNPETPETRQVEVSIEGGARGGNLYIDGVLQPDWLSTRFYPLKPGPHTFSFRLNDPDCCESPVVTKVIELAEEPDRVTLTVSYRDAELYVYGDPGSFSCPSLFAGVLRVPGRKQIPMRDPNVREPCTYTPDSPGASPPWSDHVNLTAGNTTEVTMP